jgi:hypothetical protein
VTDIVYFCPTEATSFCNLAEASFGALDTTGVDPKDSPIPEAFVSIGKIKL